MANYNLVVDSTFRPFTYKELSEPLIQATQLHRQVEEKYGDLDMEASIWEGLADEANDPDTYAQYKKYADDLHAAAESLNRYGLNPRTTATLQKLRGRYGSEIKPIETAYNRKKELVDNGLKEDVASGHTMVREYNPSDLSLDRFLHNPLADAGWSFSGAQVSKMVSDMAGNLKNELTENDYRKIGIPMYYEHGQKYGYSSQELLKLIMDRANGGNEYAQDIIGRIWDNAVRATGVYELPDDSNRDRIINQLYDYGEMGLYNAIGTTKYDPLYDQYSAGVALENLRHYHTMEEKLNPTSVKGLAINPLNVYTEEEMTDFKSNIDKYSKYFTQNDKGEWELTKEGLAKYKAGENLNIEMAPMEPGTENIRTSGTTPISAELVIPKPHTEIEKSHSAFYEFVNDVMGVRAAGGDEHMRSAIGRGYGKYLEAWDNSKYDAKKTTEYDWTYSSEDSKNIKGQMLEALEGRPLYQVKYDREKQTYVNTNNKMSVKDLNDDKTVVLSQRTLADGSATIVMVKDKDGVVKRYRMPVGINLRAENNRDNALRAAQYLQYIATTGMIPATPGHPARQATAEEVADATEKYGEYLQSAGFYQSQVGYQDHTKSQDVEVVAQ